MAGGGSIKKIDDNKWRIEIALGTDATGKRRRHVRTFHGTKKEAQQYVTAYLRDVDLGKYVDPTHETLDAYMARWLDGIAKVRVKTRTWQDYRIIYSLYIGKALGDKPVRHVTTKVLQAHYTRLLGEGKSPRTVRYAHAILRSAFKHGIKLRELAENPCEHVQLPKQLRKEHPVIGAPEQAKRFLDVLENSRHGAMLAVALFGGLRPSEYQALKPEDVDWLEGTVTVRRSMEWLRGGGWQVSETKTNRSRRQVTLPPRVMRMLRRHLQHVEAMRERAKALWRENGLLFPGPDGGPVERASLTRYHLRPMLRAAGLPEGMRLYDLRHSCATLLLSAGENLKVVSERLGHSSIMMTGDVYMHVTPTMQRQAADKLQAMLGEEPEEGLVDSELPE